MADIVAGIADLAALQTLFRELGHLKRARCASRDGSVAERLFLGSWQAMVQGEPVAQVMARTCAAALAAVRLGDLDRRCLLDLGLNEADALAVLRRAFNEVSGPIDASFAATLNTALREGAPRAAEAPAFAQQLAAQPRAGVTCPGKPRIMLLPAENHAEHCLMVAVYGALAAPLWRADPARVFLAGLAHHLHNAVMPDGGFTGEMLLGESLMPAVHHAREAALLMIPLELKAQVVDCIALIGDDVTAEARAFHAADVLDRVLEIEQHLTRTGLTMGEVLGSYALVHDSPIKPFHDHVLAAAGLL